LNRGGAAGPLTDDEIRQMQREFRQRRADAEELRQGLRGLGEDVSDLDELIRAMRRLDDSRAYNDIQEIQALQAAMLEVAKRFEFGLRRRLGGEGDEILLKGSDEVPPGFEDLVEEYYRALARGRGGS
jgi:hypothetical protein